MRPNWFLAFPLAGAFVLELPKPPASIRLFHPDDVHLTLSFLGPVSETAAERGFAALLTALESAPLAAQTLSLGPVVAMGRPREYTALSALLARGREKMEQVLGEYRGPVADAAGVRADRRPPKPHVTLARPRRRAGDEERKAGLDWAASLELGHVEASLDRVALYTWSEMRRERWFRIVREHRLERHPKGG
jgi:RNA 2',3'-cyclic 3'-phosphodiesterase